MHMSLDDFSNKRVGLLAGGGLFSWVLAHVFREAAIPVHVYCANVGQVDETQFSSFKSDVTDAGIPLIEVDLRQPMAEMAFEVARYQAHHQGGYWNTTGALRALLVKNLAPRMEQDGCEVIAHGSVGGGNDQQRFARYLAHFTPSIPVYVPWADKRVAARFAGRGEMVAYLQRRTPIAGLEQKTNHSSDGSLMGISHEGTDLETGDQPWIQASFKLTSLPQRAPNEPATVRIEFERGNVRLVEEEQGTALQLMTAVNSLAGTNGIGLASVIERRINGTKCRGIYEAPGMSLLGFAYNQLYDATLSTAAQTLFRQLSQSLGRWLYEGRYFDPDAEAAKTALAELTSKLNGLLDIQLYKGNMHLMFQSGPRDEMYECRFLGGGHQWRLNEISNVL